MIIFSIVFSFIVLLVYKHFYIIIKAYVVNLSYKTDVVYIFNTLLITFILSITPLLVVSQELPPLEIFTPQTYGAEDQNWSISQSANKTIYIANNGGLLEYNGAKWKLYDTPNNSILRSVEAFEDRVYTGSYMDFGFWEKDKYGLLVYTSLSADISDKLIEDEEFWEIIALEDWIMFQSLDRIYIYNSTDHSFKIIDSNTRIIKMYSVDETIYFQKINDGIYKIENGQEVLVTSSKDIIDKEIVNIFMVEKDLLFQTKEDGFYSFINEIVSEWVINASELLSSITVYSSVRLLNGNFILGTISNGIIYLSADGEMLLQIDQSSVLSNNTVLSVFEDSSGNVWLGLDNGINILNLNSPYKVYKDNQKVLGTIYASAKTDAYLYLGTNQGLFCRPSNSNGEFEFVKGTKGQVWSLQSINGTLFCGHDKGTFVIKNKTANIISDEKGTWVVKAIKGAPSLLIQGNYNGLSILEKNSRDKWEFKNKLEGFNISSRYFEFLSSTELLVSHEYKGVYKLKIDDSYTSIISSNKESIDKGINSCLINYNDKLFYIYEDGVFNYNETDLTFKKDSILSVFFNQSNYVSGKLVNDIEGNKLWGFSEDHMTYLEPGKLTDIPKIKTLPLPNQVRKSKSGYENLLYLEEGVYLMGTVEGYLIIDLNKLKPKHPEVKLNTISYNSLHNERIPLEIAKDGELSYKDNNMFFTYSVADFNKFSPILYQYKLLGIYNDWSSWSSDSDILFENLPHGDYTFEVRAKVDDMLSKNNTIFSFNIEKPWHLKPLAIALYILTFIIIVIIVQSLNRAYYKSQKKRLIETKERELEFKELENQRQLMEFKNQNLHQDIESKNRELGISTMNLIKKNEFLNNIKEQLKSAESIGGLKNVIQIIDKNINNTEDWKFFEEAFNNADKDFLKKVKNLHNSLTPNDLKLCAYLRLNLSSKEIAPLLNISHRSVEVKRYRLRKKMNLPHETSLTNYILEI